MVTFDTIATGKGPRISKPPKGQFFFAERCWDRVAWWKSPNLRKVYFYCIVLLIGNVANGFDGSMMNGLQSLKYWVDYFDDPQGWRLGLLSSIMTVGCFVGLPLLSPICDHLGRKYGVLIGSLIVCLGVGLQAGATSFGMFLAARFLIGMGMALATGAGPMLVAEISHPQDRAILCTFMGVGWSMGSFISSWTTYGTLQIQSDWAWRLPSLLHCTCTVMVLATWWWIPESPRFCISKDRESDAMRVVAHYHADGNTEDEFVKVEYSEIYNMLMMDRQADRSSRYRDFLRTKGNRHRLAIVIALALFGQLSGNGIISYYLVKVLESIGIDSSKDQLGINGGLQAMSLAVNLVFAFYVDRIGRKPMFLFSAIMMLGAFTLLTVFSAQFNVTGETNMNYARGVVAMIFLYSFAYNFKTGLGVTYNLEILPYGLRAKGTTIGNLTIQVSLFFNQFVNPIAFDAIAWRYYFVYIGVLCFEVWFIWTYLVETRFTPLEEVARFFDGEEADVARVVVMEGKGVDEGLRGKSVGDEGKRGAGEVEVKGL